MINGLLVFYDNTLLYHSNSAFLFFFAIFAFFLFLFFRCLWFLAQLLQSVVTEVRQLYKLKVLRNKIIAKIIYSPVKRIEYDAHQQLIDYLERKAPEADKKTYQDIDFFLIEL